MRLPLLAVATLLAPLALAACNREEREPPAAPAAEPATPAPAPPPVEAPPAPRANTTAPAPHRTAREMRDGPGSDAAPDYAGSRGAATSLPSDSDDASASNTTSDSGRTAPSRDGPRDPPG